MDTRRNFLKKAATLAGSASLMHIMPASIAKAMAISPEPGSTFYDAEHVVLLMQENRSFGHAFGTLQGVRGYTASVLIDLHKNYNWYDFAVRCKGYDDFSERFAGRIENGENLKTDPLMGAML